ncbi:hypothetical protein T4B_1765, partial [Trichinella pseudospiralis]
LLRVVLDLLRVVRDLLRVVRVFTFSLLHCPYLNTTRKIEYFEQLNMNLCS